MDHSTVPIKFEYLGISYEGWANPSRKQNDYGMPESYQVVLNKESFGNLSLDRGKWVTDEKRPHELVVRVGKFLDEYVHLFVAA
jgi:hypothetical protein